MHSPGIDAPPDNHALVDILARRGIRMEHPHEVRRYLDRYPELGDILLSACGEIFNCFDTRARLSLDLYRDPEIADDYLTLYVRQEHYDGDILDILDGIAASLDSQLAASSGWLLLTSDFQPPR